MVQIRRTEEGEHRLRAATTGEPERLDGTIVLVAYDERWPEQYDHEASRVREILNGHALRIEHVGSTSVPRLCAKPIIDILLVVADSAAEQDYVPPMEHAGYVLRIREPEWHQHRVLKGPGVSINLHVFSAGCREIERMIGFRDHLRRNATDRNLYQQAKQELAGRRWHFVQEYADAKTEVVEAIIARMQSMGRSGP